jgi:hypothetical protein
MRIFLTRLFLLFFISCTHTMEIDFLPAEILQNILVYALFPKYDPNIRYNENSTLDVSFYTYLKGNKPDSEQYYILCSVNKAFKSNVQQTTKIIARDIYKTFILPLFPQNEETINPDFLVKVGWNEINNEQFEYNPFKILGFNKYNCVYKLIYNFTKALRFPFFYEFDAQAGNPHDHFALPYTLESQNKYLLDYVKNRVDKNCTKATALYYFISCFNENDRILISNTVIDVNAKGTWWHCKAEYNFKLDNLNRKSLFLIMTQLLTETERTKKESITFIRFMQSVLNSIFILMSQKS